MKKNYNKENSKYISSSALLFHLYNLVILTICLLEAIFHKYLRKYLVNNLRIFTTGSGKAGLVVIILIFFITSEESTFLLLTVSYVIGAIALFVFDNIFECNIEHLEFQSRKNNQENS